MSFFNIT